MQALSCYIYIYTSITLHAIQTQNLTLTWDHNPKGAKLNFPVLGSHCGGLGLSWHPAFQAHVYFHSSSKKKKKKKLVKNPELLIQERFQRLAKFQTQSMEKNKCTDLLARDTSIHAQFARALGWFSQMEQP